DEICVLEYLPTAFDKERETQPQAQGPVPPYEPEQAVEDKAVNDMRKGVPVGEVLRVLRTHHHAVPELDITAFADRHAAHRKKRDSGCSENEDGEEGVAAPCRHALAQRGSFRFRRSMNFAVSMR